MQKEGETTSTAVKMIGDLRELRANAAMRISRPWNIMAENELGILSPQRIEKLSLDPRERDQEFRQHLSFAHN